MNNIEKIQGMSIEELAKLIIGIEKLELDVFCKSDCKGDFENDDPDKMCPHPMQCCEKWLMEDVNEQLWQRQ